MVLVGIFLVLLLKGCTSESSKFWERSFPEECGVTSFPENRIIGGRDAALGEQPWIVLLKYTAPMAESQFCGGALINSRFIITAAHCYDSYAPSHVRLGVYYKRSNKACDDEKCTPNVQTIPIEKSFLHENYSKTSTIRDIALIKLSREVEFNDFVKPICVPKRDITSKKDKYQVSGWGVTNINQYSAHNTLQTVTVERMAYSKCKHVLDKKEFNNKNVICAAGDNKDSCSGDSGGPLTKISDIDGTPRNYLVGVVSFGGDPCGHLGVYTNVAYYYDWIVNKLKREI